jgi:hypothetical protein
LVGVNNFLFHIEDTGDIIEFGNERILGMRVFLSLRERG